jgi:hypothetical protein
VDHHDDWMHWPPDGPEPHGDPGAHGDAAHELGDPGGHGDDLGGHDLGVDPFGGDHLADVSGHDPYGPADDGMGGHDPYGPADLRHDADLGDVPGHGTPDQSTMDGPGAAEAGIDVHVVGVDHDVPPGDAPDPDFPPPLDLPDRPEPVDGYPWSDPATLGDIGTVTGLPQFADGAPPADDLLSYAGMDPPGPGVDPWAALADSDDPAVSALARWWGPAG